MSVWTWVLVGLCVVGALLAVTSLSIVAVQALKLRARVRELQNSRLFMSLESLQLQSARLSRLSTQQVQPLTQRAQAAVSQMQACVQESGLPQARATLQETGAQISALLDELR
jgi:hypothetical protein